MNKYILIIIVVLFSYNTLYSQIGINTETPKGILHIDALGNNPINTNPSIIQQKDDVVFSLDSNGIPSMVIGKTPDGKSTQLELTDPNKAFLPNRVSLKSTTDITTVPNPIDGMIVYNTNNRGGATITDVNPGLYLFYNNEWHYLLTNNSGSVNFRKLQTAVTTSACSSTDYNCASLLNYGSPLVIEEEGAYGFSMRFFGSSDQTTTGPIRLYIYIWVLANGIPVDVAELNPTIFPKAEGANGTYSVTMSGNFKKGDVVTFKLSKGNADNQPSFSLPANTGSSMFYWKIEQYSAS
jgi:hypothetical protein